MDIIIDAKFVILSAAKDLDSSEYVRMTPLYSFIRT